MSILTTKLLNICGEDLFAKRRKLGKAVEKWQSFASDEGCQYDDTVTFDASEIAPTVTWDPTPARQSP